MIEVCPSCGQALEPLQHVWGAQWGRHRPHGVWVASPVPSPDAEWEWDIADLIEYGRQRSRGGTAE